jgi:hypothetical protein
MRPISAISSVMMLGCVVILQGCSTVPPAPSVMDGSGSLIVDLPADVAKSGSFPPNLRGTFSIHAKAESISIAPPRSRYQGTIKIHVADPSGRITYVDVDTTITGEGDGMPNDGIREYFNRLVDVVKVMKRTLPATTQPKTN